MALRSLRVLVHGMFKVNDEILTYFDDSSWIHLKVEEQANLKVVHGFMSLHDVSSSRVSPVQAKFLRKLSFQDT